MPSSLQLHNKLQKYTDKALRQLGMPAKLRRAEGDRSCTVVLNEFTALERLGRTLDPLDNKALVSAKGLTIPPDSEKDRLVTLVPGTNTEESIYRIVARPRPLAPAGVVLYWELTVRKY